MLPFIGDAQAVADAKTDYEKGNYGMAAFNAATAIPVLGDIAALAKVGIPTAAGIGGLMRQMAQRSGDVPVTPFGKQAGSIGSKLPMDEASRMARAKDMGFDVDDPIYHGTGNLEGFTEFKPVFTGGGADQYGGGFYSTTDPAEASGYAMDATRGSGKIEANSSGVVPMYSKMKKYIDVDPTKQRNLGDVIDLDQEQVRAMLDHSKALKRSVDNEAMNPLGDHYDSFWESGAEDWMLDDIAEKYKGNPDAIEMELFDNDPEAFRAALSEVTGMDGIRVNFDDKSHVINWKPEQLRSINAAFDPAKKSSADLLAGGLLGAIGLKAYNQSNKEDKPK